MRERAMPKILARASEVSTIGNKQNYWPRRTDTSPILHNFTKTTGRQAFDTISTNGNTLICGKES